MVFCERKKECDELVSYLASLPTPIEARAMYSYKEDKKAEENAIKDEFKKPDGTLRVIVCTDYVARGYDVPCDLVVCYNLPYIFDERIRKRTADVEFELYAHRTARTARAGNFGTIVNLIEGAVDENGMESIADRFKMRVIKPSDSVSLTDIVFKEWNSDETSIADLQEYIDKRRDAVEEFNRAQAKTGEVQVEDDQGNSTSFHLSCDLQYTDTKFGLPHYDELPAYMKENLEKVRKGIVNQKGMSTAFPIQAKTFPFSIVSPEADVRRNVFAQAEGGSGKTLAYIASMLAKIKTGDAKTQAICVVHNGSLREQVCRDYLAPLQKEFKEFSYIAATGQSFKDLKAGSCTDHIVIGTPEGLMNATKEHKARGKTVPAKLSLSAVSVCVIDEVCFLLSVLHLLSFHLNRIFALLSFLGTTFRFPSEFTCHSNLLPFPQTRLLNFLQSG